MKNEFKVVGHSYHIEESTRQNANMLLLNHSHLDKDPVYTSMKTDLEKFYSDSKKSNDKQPQPKKKNLNSALYSNLHSLLSEVTFTKDSTMQRQMLKTVHNWYITKSKGKSRLPDIKNKDGTNQTSQITSNSLPHSFTPLPGYVPIESPVMIEETVNRYPTPSLPRRYQSEDLTSASENLNKQYLKMRGLEQSMRREAEAKKSVIFSWGSEKSRANEDFLRKIDQSRMGSRQKRSESPAPVMTKHQRYTSIPSNRAFLYDFSIGKPLDEDIEEPSDKISLSRIQKLRKAHAELLDIGIEDQQPKKKRNESSMSIYRRGNESIDLEFDRSKSIDKFNEQLGEVIDVKNKLASRNIACPIKYLINGLVLGDEGERAMSPNTLPRGGEYLINNPLLKMNKGKKKKKKKKGKKSKK